MLVEGLEITLEDIEMRAVMPAQVLVDMKHVYGGFKPQTPGQKEVAKLMKDNFPGFMDRMTALEKTWQAALDRNAKKAVGGKGGAPQKPEEPEEDEGRVEELIDRLVTEFEDGRATGTGPVGG